MLISGVLAVCRAVRRAVDADVAEELASVRLLLLRRVEELAAVTAECASLSARVVLLEVELEAAEEECVRLEAELAG